jgi:beta-glucosidase
VSDEPQRPARWLAGFAVAHLDPGDSADLTVTIARRAFEVWDPQAHQWRLPAGEYRLHIGRSIADIRLSAGMTR